MKLWIALLGILLCVDLVMLHDLLRFPQEPTLHLLDVGQGDALLLQSAEGHQVLIDGGPGQEVLMELSAVLPESFRQIDLVVLTHPHLDHMEGLIPVLERFSVKAILMSAPAYDSLAYKAFLAAVQNENVPVYFANASTDFRLGSLHLDVLYPFEPQVGEEMENINNASVVIKVDEWLLLTGDAEIEVEEALLSQELDLRASVLKAGHHGSRTSSTEAFLDAVNPDLMLISSGGGNSFGHPHSETLEKAQLRGIQLWRTDLNGRLSIYASDLSAQPP